MGNAPEDGQYRADFFVDGKLNIRKLRHDMAAAIGVALQMLDTETQNPSRKAACDALLRDAIQRLNVIRESLYEENYDKDDANPDLVELTEDDPI